MKKSISIIGGGSSALMLAAFLDAYKFDVCIYEKNKTLARKFLVAGDGGFNLTHSEPIAQFIQRYTPTDFLEKALLHFDNVDLRNWLAEIGIPTFIGSSKRVYPEKGIKPIEVLSAILAVLNKQGVRIKYEHCFTGWNDKHELVFNDAVEVKSDYTVFSLGGGSWKVTGANDAWLKLFKEQAVEVKPFQASNCAYNVKWPNDFISKYEGQPLKNIAISCLNKYQKGEVVVTRSGLEGNAIYALSPQLTQELNGNGGATVFIDLKPTLKDDEVLKKMKSSVQKNVTQTLKKELHLSEVQIGLLKSFVHKEGYLNTEKLARYIAHLPIQITGTAPLDEAISTVGGIALTEVDEHFQLKKRENTFCIGEMLDWNAPTGGYLLQACFSMGVYLAHYLNDLD